MIHVNQTTPWLDCKREGWCVDRPVAAKDIEIRTMVRQNKQEIIWGWRTMDLQSFIRRDGELISSSQPRLLLCNRGARSHDLQEHR